MVSRRSSNMAAKVVIVPKHVVVVTFQGLFVYYFPKARDALNSFTFSSVLLNIIFLIEYHIYEMNERESFPPPGLDVSHPIQYTANSRYPSPYG